MELAVFVVAAAVCLAGAIGVVASSNPVHAALSLVATLFGVAVLFVAQEANFLAAVQVIVYAGAIVVLFLFVIMFLGVDQAENLRVEPLGGGQRIAAGLLGAGVVALVLAALADTGGEATGAPSLVAPLSGTDTPDINVLGEAIFTRYVFAFELTSVLLVIAVVGAVLMVSRARPGEEIAEPGQAERRAEIEERIARAEARVNGHEEPAEVAPETADASTRQEVGA
jgi:NADH-quinone oxidoreductase subunit J